jgi:hypothetical protein
VGYFPIMASTDSAQVFLRWLRAALRPVLRLCLRHAVPLNDCVEVLKQAYLDVAGEDLRRRSLPVSASKLSLMTGVHRKDIARFKTDSSERGSRMNSAAKIIAAWQHYEQFATRKGKPRILSAEGIGSEFAALVSLAIGTDVSPYTAQQELQRLGAIERNGNKVKLLWSEYAPRVNSAEGLNMLEEDVGDLYAAVTENIYEEPKIPNLHLKTEYTEIPESRINEVRNWLIAYGTREHKAVRQYLSAIEQSSSATKESEQHRRNVRVGYTSFSICHQTENAL